MKVYLETFGCQMNRLDSELVAGRLRAEGHELVADPSAAEAVLYNTCSVRRHAEEKAYSRLGEQSKRKAGGGGRLIIAVLGCMAQQKGDSIFEDFPRVDVVCGPGEIDRLGELIELAGRTRERQLAVAPDRKNRDKSFDEDANARLEAFDLARPCGSASQAFVRVQRGCDKFCAYCVVPHVRGSEQSRDPEMVVEEVRRLAGGGCREVTLLGQTVSSYRWDGGGRAVGLAELLERLNSVPGIDRIRFVTSYPSGFDRAILRAMRDLPKVCEYLHLPAQSGSDRVLKAMHRRYTVAEYLELITEAKATVPGLAVAGDFIVGFPGETEEDFALSCLLIRQAAYKNSFLFMYSPREGTFAAERMGDDVPMNVKRRRHRELLAVQNQVSLAHHTAMIGTVVEVLAEGPSPRAGKQPAAPKPGESQLQGRTRGDHIVVFDGPLALAGQFVRVRLTAASALALRGERADA